MSILLYVNDDVPGKRLQKVIRRTIPQERLEVFRSFITFSKRTRRFPRDLKVAVLVARYNEEISKFVSLKDYLEDIRIILILPDLDRETVSKGLPLGPAFVEYIGGDFTNIGAVLEKIFQNINSNQTKTGGEKHDKRNRDYEPGSSGYRGQGG